MYGTPRRRYDEYYYEILTTPSFFLGIWFVLKWKKYHQEQDKFNNNNEEEEEDKNKESVSLTRLGR